MHWCSLAGDQFTRTRECPFGHASGGTSGAPRHCRREATGFARGRTSYTLLSLDTRFSLSLSLLERFLLESIYTYGKIYGWAEVIELWLVYNGVSTIAWKYIEMSMHCYFKSVARFLCRKPLCSCRTWKNCGEITMQENALQWNCR